MPKINEILLKLNFFQYAMSLYLNMGYYNIQRRKKINNLCSIILPWVKHSYKRPPIVVDNCLENFQQKIIYLFHGFEFVHAYIDKLLILIKVDWIDHVQMLEITLNKLTKKDLNVILKSLSSDKPKCNI